MEISPRFAGSGATQRAPELHPEATAYLTQLAREQDRFLAGLAEAGARVGEGAGQLGKVAAIQSRMTQEFLDAQRSIIRRRAETEATVVQIARAAEIDAQMVYAEIPSVLTPAPTGWPSPSSLPAPSGWSPPARRATARILRLESSPVDLLPEPQIAGAEMASIARLVDGAFEQREPDGDVMRRQLREVLDSWWTAEKQEGKAAIDDATARAAMRLHVARAEAADLARADVVRAEFASPTYRYEPPRHVSPLITALDTTTHEDLDEVLASLLDGLDDRPLSDVSNEHVGHGVPLARPLSPPLPRVVAPSTDSIPSPLPPPPAGSVSGHGDVDSLTDETAAPQEAFDRFWGPWTARNPGGRDWVFPQLLFPAVAVIAVLALVLAVIG